MPGVDVLAMSFRLTLNRNIVHESAYMNACPYQVIRNDLYEETNEQHIFSKVFCMHFKFHVYVYIIYIYQL